MRSDVVLTDEMVAEELALAQSRLRQSGLADASSWRPTPVCDVSMLRHEVIDRVVVYLRDAPTCALVGLFTFQRVPSRRVPLRVPMAIPHAKLLPGHRGLGLARWVYEREMALGRCLLSSARQSVAAARLWQSLARSFGHSYVWVDGRQLRHLGPTLAQDERDRLEVRMLLHSPALGIRDRLALHLGEGRQAVRLKSRRAGNLARNVPSHPQGIGDE